MLNKPTGDMLNAAGSATPQALGTAAAGTATAYSREDHVHAIPALSGDVTNDGLSVTVAKLQSSPVASTTPASGQVLTWDGAQWAPATNSSGGGGGANGLTYYLNQGTAADAPTTGITGTPHQLGRTGESGQTTVTSGTLTQNVWTLIAGFVSESTPIDPDVTLIPAGLWDFNIWAYGDANINAGTSIRCRVYKYNGSTLTEIASPSSDQVINGTSAQYSLSVLVPQTTLELTDRIYVAIEARATASGHSITAQFGDSTPSHVHTSLPLVGGTGLWKSVAGVLQSPASLLVNDDVDAAAAIAWSKIAPSYFGAQVKVVGRDAATIQGCIDLCTSASSTNPFTVLIPPKAGDYEESLTLTGSVALIGLTNALNSDAIQIRGSHTYAPDLASGNSNRIGFENLTFISASLTDNTISVVAGAVGTKYASQLRFSGCVFSGGKNSGVSHISTCDNVTLYIDNCRFESSTGNSGSVGITQGNGPLYINNNTVFDVFGKALDIPASTTVTKTATSTFGSTTLTVSDVTGLSVGQKISGTGLYSTTTVVSITAPSTVVMSTPPQTATGGFTATFGQTPYVEIHDAILIGKGTDVVTLGSGLLTATNVNFSSSTGNGINLASAYTVLGLVNCSFGISITTAGIYVITGAANTYAALNSVSYSNSALSSVFVGIIPAYNTSINSNVTVYDYSARATSIENGGTGQITRQAALNALAGAVTSARVLAGDGTNITLRALAAADIPSLAASKITSGTLAAAQGGTGTTAGIANINTTQIAALTTAQTANLIPKLTTSGLISLAQLGGIGTTQIAALTTAQTANFIPQLTTSGLLSLTQMPTLPVANGGTGTTTSTGTGAVVLGTVPTLSGYTETVTALGTVGAAVTLSLAASNFLTATLTNGTACTFTMPTATAGKTFVLLLKQPATGAVSSVTFTGVKFPAGTTLSPTLARMDIFQFRADGTNWYANVIGQNYTY